MLHTLEKFRIRTTQSCIKSHSSSRFVLFATAGFALILTGCGGGGSSSSAVVPGNDGSSGALVTSGEFAGLDQDCVDTLLDINPNAPTNTIQLTCRPENIETVPPAEVTDPPVDDMFVQEPIITPSTTPGLNIAPADIAGGSFYQNSRVSALLSGPEFGTGARPNSELVKPLAMQIDDEAPNLQLVELRALRSSNGRDSTDYLGVVQNTGSDFQCSITLEDLMEFSSTGQPIVNEDDLDFALLQGEIGTSIFDTGADAFYFASCLPPGSLGYILSFRGTTSFDEVAEVTAQSLRSSSDRVQVDGSMLPVSYRVEIDGSVTITIVNNHSEPLDVFSVDAIAIDEQGHAFSVDLELPLTIVAPGAELDVPNLFPRFEGRASTIRAIIDFDQS